MVGRAITIGRWSEFSLTCVDQDNARAKCAEGNEMSGEDGLPFVGRRVGEFSFSIMKGEFCMALANISPLVSTKEDAHPV